MAIKATIRWIVHETATDRQVEDVSHTTMVNSYADIQPKVLTKLSRSYNAKALEKDLKFQDNLGPSKDRGGYTIAEFQDDAKEHDIVIICSILNHN